MTNQTLLQKIIANIKAKVNSFAFNRLQASGNFDPAQAYWDMREYGYADLGEYARVSFFSKLFSRKDKITATTHYTSFYRY